MSGRFPHKSRIPSFSVFMINMTGLKKIVLMALYLSDRFRFFFFFNPVAESIHVTETHDS